MTRIIAVSNRVAKPKVGGAAAGGLAVGILSALEEAGGMWFGWSGQTIQSEPRDPTITTINNVSYATLDLREDDYDGYYNGFSNNTLWPLFHYLLGYFSYSRKQYDAYCRVNVLFARKLAPLLQQDDIIWVHDYHLIPLASELRRAGVTQPIGFFLHVPFPDYDLLRALPPYEHMLRSLAAYDVVGFQTARDLWSFTEALRQPDVGGRALDYGWVEAYGRRFLADVFPIGIDVEQCEREAQDHQGHPTLKRLVDSLKGRDLVIGVDRLDYSKGLELRFRAYERLLEKYPASNGRTILMQIAPPTRTGVRAYESIRQNLEQAAGNINGRFADIDWVPIRYLNRGYDRAVLMALYRRARGGPCDADPRRNEPGRQGIHRSPRT